MKHQRSQWGGRKPGPSPRIKQDCSPEWLESLAGRVSYTGSEAHKRNAGNFGVGTRPRPDATLCDEVKIYDKEVAERLLKGGVEAGLVSEQTDNDYPKQIWSVQDDLVFEAQLENREQGTYHGYPLLNRVDSRRQSILTHLEKAHGQQT